MVKKSLSLVHMYLNMCSLFPKVLCPTETYVTVVTVVSRIPVVYVTSKMGHVAFYSIYINKYLPKLPPIS